MSHAFAPPPLRHLSAACLLLLGFGTAALSLVELARGERRVFGPVAHTLRPLQEAATALWPRLPAADESGWTLLLHWDPTCPCSTRAQRSIEGFIDRLPGRTRLLVMVPDASARAAVQRRFAAWQPVVLGPEQLPAPPASPAAALFDPRGALRYLGPVGSGAGCTAPALGRDAMPPMLAALIEDRVALLTPTTVWGCFCPWAQPVAATVSARTTLLRIDIDDRPERQFA